MRFRAISRVLVIFQLLVTPIWAEPPAPPVLYGLLPESKAMRPPVFKVIPNSQFAGLAAVKLVNGEVTYLSQAEVTSLESSGQSFPQTAVANAKIRLDSIKPRWLLDRDKVIQCAILESDSPLTASVVMAPNFLDQFADIFGPEVIVAMPTRTRIYIFPKVANRLSDYIPEILSAYRSAAYPISPEAFEVSAKGIRVIGELDDR